MSNTRFTLRYTDSYGATKESVIVLLGALTDEQLVSLSQSLHGADSFIAHAVGIRSPLEDMVFEAGGFEEGRDHPWTSIAEIEDLHGDLTVSVFIDNLPATEKITAEEFVREIVRINQSEEWTLIENAETLRLSQVYPISSDIDDLELPDLSEGHECAVLAKTVEQFFAVNVRTTKIIHVPTQIRAENMPLELQDLFEEDGDSIAHALEVDEELLNTPSNLSELVDLLQQDGKKGFLLQCDTPVPSNYGKTSEVHTWSWSDYHTFWIYGNSLDSAYQAAMDYAKTYPARRFNQVKKQPLS